VRTATTTLLLATLVLGTGACSSEAPEATAPTTSLAPTTTFMPDCSLMPTAADISADVGVPLAEGTVVGTGTCQYSGLNDQSQVVQLAVYLDPADQAAFSDLQASLGTPVAYMDPALADAFVGADSTLFVTANGAIYTARVAVTGATAAEQVPLAAKVLTRWLGQ
jgi:hypothetical protein